MKLTPTFNRRALWIAAAVAIAAYYPRFIKDAGGLQVYPAAAACMLRGETPLHCTSSVFASPFAYPPFFALLSAPLVAMPVWLQEAFWYVVLIGTLFGSLRLCEVLGRRMFPGEWTERELAQFRILSFVLSLKFVLAVLENQAFDSISLIFILLSLLALVSQRSILAGASLGFATALKITPILFLPYLLIKRRYASAVAFVVALAFLTLLPDILLPPKESSHAVVWLREVVIAPFYKDADTLYPTFWLSNSPMNQSLRGMLARVTSGGIQHDIVDSPGFNVLLRTVMGLYVLGVGAIILKSLRHDRLIALDGGLLIVSALLLSPVSSQSHFVGLMLPYSMLAAVLIKNHPTRVLVAAFLLTSYVLTTATSNDLVGRTFTGWALWNSLPMWGTLTLAVALGVLIWIMASDRRYRAPNQKL